MGEFGEEFVNVEVASSGIGGDIPVTDLLSELARRPRPSYLYFAHRIFRLRVSQRLPLVRFPDGQARRVLVFPENVTLWFGPGGKLTLEPGVAVIVRGQIRAGAGTIFELPHVVDDAAAPESAIVRIETELMDELLVEWFGVVPTSAFGVGDPGVANPAQRLLNARAIQACLNAACRDRSRSTFEENAIVAQEMRERRLPPLTVVCRGIYDYAETLVASARPGQRPSLWMQGDNSVRRGSYGIPALRRHSLAGVTEASDSAALRVDDAVSVEMVDLGVKVMHPGGESFPRGPGVASTVRIHEGPATWRWRHVFLDRCGLHGGRDAAVRIVDPEVVGGAIGGSPPGTPALQSRGTRYALSGCVLDAKFGSAQSSQFVMDVALSQDAMLEINGGLVYQTGPFYRSGTPPRPGGDRTYHMDLDAGIQLRGASILVRGVSFQLAEGPRPTRDAPATRAPALPDGQDLWIDTAEGALGAHLTALHCDSQSWWFLGSSFPTRDEARGAVSVLNAGAGNVNWPDYAGIVDDNGVPVGPQIAAIITNGQVDVLVDPPSVAWAGGGTPLLLEGCLFKRYVTLGGDTSLVASVSTTMHVPAVAREPTWWLSPAAIPRGAPPRTRLINVSSSEWRAPSELRVRWESQRT